MLVYLAAALFSAITLPWKGSADAFAHMDYVYQVHHGQIPDAFGYQYRKVDLRKFNIGDADKTQQWAASHPPLFYYIAALQMGKPLDSGKWEVAVKRGRLLNIGIGFLCVVALAWAGWRLGGRYRNRLAVALPTIGGTLTIFIRLAGEIYNDLLVTLFSILAITLSCIILSDGLKRKYLIALAVVCALGMASKATFVFALVLALGAVFMAVARYRSGLMVPRLLHGALASAALAIAAILPIYWFYLGNYRASGSWFLPTVRKAFQNRKQMSSWDVLTNDDYWLVVPRGLLGPEWSSTWPFNDQLSLWLSIFCALALAFLFLARGYWRRFAAFDWRVLAWLLIAAHFAGLMFAQWRHATGWGALNFRYFLPALLSISLFLAVPAVAWKRASGWLVACIGGLMVVSGVMSAITYLDRRYAFIAEGEGSWSRLMAATVSNEISVGWVWVLLWVMAIGLLVVGWAVAHSDETEAAAPEVKPQPAT